MSRAVLIRGLVVIAVSVALACMPEFAVAQHGHGGGGGFHGGGSGIHGGWGGFHGGGSFHGGGIHGGNFGGFHGGGFHGGNFGGFRGGNFGGFHHGGFRGYPYYGGYYGYPWYGYGLSFGFGFGPYWGYPYYYGYGPWWGAYSYSYPYGSYYPSGSYDDPRDPSSGPGDPERSSDRSYSRDNRDRCDYRYQDTCPPDDEKAPTKPSNGTAPDSSTQRNYVTMHLWDGSPPLSTADYR